jgi:hypothetical protein
LGVYHRLLEQTSQIAQRRCAAPLWHGHRTFLVDGSSFSMPDTPALQAAFGQQGQQAEGCGFPIAHWLAMFDAHTGLLIKQFAAPLRTHDMSLAACLHPALRAGDMIVGDTAFASYAHLASLLQRKLHGVFRAHQRTLISFCKDRKLTGKLPKGTRATQATGRLVRKLGKYDQLVEYRKPSRCPGWMSREAYEALPEQIVVRELRYVVKRKKCRTRVVTLVTTLVDAEQYPAEELTSLYGIRWSIETNLGHLKTTMGMDVLHCESVEGVMKELTIYALVYNLIRVVMLQAAVKQRTSVHRISFVDAMRWLAQACVQMLPLHLLCNPQRPNRYEPRCRKRRMKEYDLMNIPRKELRKRLVAKGVAA